jgi:crotonobetainyl-CoA:carnitine CoA-transferase CaiB-like acyl-CoA transferase
LRPLDGVFVLDLSRVLAGPFATMRLADLGARVVKIESPEGDPTRRFGPPFVDGESAYYLSLNRGKESVVLDLARPAARTVVERLVRRADVLVENFRPGGLARLGFADADLERAKPDLVHCRISGFGTGHPREHEPVFDLAIQAESGFMDMTGSARGEPVRAGVSLADLAAGAAAVEGVLAALFRRERTRRGARIEVSLLDSILALFGYQAQSYLACGVEPERMGSRHPNLVPYQAFATTDGWIVLAVAMAAHWRALLAVEGMPADLDRPAWAHNAGRVAGRVELESVLAAALRRGTSAEWLERLSRAGIPCGAVRKTGETLAELRALETGLVRDWRHGTLGPLPMVSTPLRFDGRREPSELPPALHGEHTASVLRECAESPDELASWLRELAGPA